MTARSQRLERTRRRAGAVVAATLLHGAVLVALSRSITTAAPPPATEPLTVELLRPPRTVATASSSSPPPRRQAGPAQERRPSPATVSRSAETARPATATSGPGRASDAAPGAADGAGSGSDGDALRALAALFACHGGGGDLDPASRARCEAGRLRASREAPHVDAMPAEKRAYYDAVSAAHEDERAFRPVGAYFDPRDNRGPSGARSRGVDAGFGYRCNIALGHGAAEANRRAGVRWAVPPCAPMPPVGSLTYEARAPPPLTAREQAADARDDSRLDAPTSPAAPPRA